MGAAHLSVRTACNRWPTACGKEEWDATAIHPTDAPRAVREYLDTLDKATFGAASEAQPKFTSHSDPASQWTAARKGPASFSYSDNYLIDTDHGVIVDVGATRSIRRAEVGSTETMLERVKTKFDLHPERLIADTAYGTASMLGWLVDHKIARHIPVFDKSGRNDGTWTRADFESDAENNQYICPEGQELKQFRRNYSDPNRGPTWKGTARYRALKEVCQACPSKAKCCPNADARKIIREEHEDARQVAREIAKTEQYVISMKLRKKVEMLFAHLKRILGLNRLRLRGPCGANSSSSPQPPRTFGNWPRYFLHRRNREEPNRKGVRAFSSGRYSALATGRFSTESAFSEHSSYSELASNRSRT